jgi:hypothetical protein
MVSRTEWKTQSGSGFETFLTDGFQFAGLDRNLDEMGWMADYLFGALCWPRSACRYLAGNFNTGGLLSGTTSAPSTRLVPLIKLWAYGHRCLYARSSTLQGEARLHR